MKSMRPLVAFLAVIAIAALSCGGSGGGGGGVNPKSNQPIGTIALIRTRVEAGRSGNIQDVEGSRDFYDDESVRVRDNGKGKISFNDGSQITLYNNTSTERVIAQFSPPEIRIVLTEQGFQGYVPKGSTFIADMPNGTQVTILGTHFFVLYDPDSGFSTVGNFDGTVRFTPPGGSEQELPPGTMVDIAPDGRVDFYELPYNPDTFDSTADDSRSPVEGLQTLRRQFKQPQPGEQPAAAPATVIRYLVVREGDSFVPDLAEGWSEDPDGYIIEFFLRKDVTLPDGSPFTSDYVKMRLSEEWAYAREGHAALEVIDDYVIRFFLDSPSISYVLEEMSKFGFEVLP